MPSSDLQLLLIDCGSRKFDALRALVDRTGAASWTVRLDDLTGSFRPSADALVISGGPHLFTDDDEAKRRRLRERFAFLDGETPPVFGICLGFQALVLAAGGEVYRGAERRREDRIALGEPHPLTRGLPPLTSFAEDHCEGVRVPSHMDVLGAVEFYPVEVAAEETRQRYGVQFHPELSGEPGECILRNFLELVRRREE